MGQKQKHYLITKEEEKKYSGTKESAADVYM